MPVWISEDSSSRVDVANIRLQANQAWTSAPFGRMAATGTNQE